MHPALNTVRSTVEQRSIIGLPSTCEAVTLRGLHHSVPSGPASGITSWSCCRADGGPSPQARARALLRAARGRGRAELLTLFWSRKVNWPHVDVHPGHGRTI